MLPSKFQLGRVALHNSIPIGYLIGSRCDGKWGHIHRFEDVCLAVRIAGLTLESLVTRDAANAFYERTGFAGGSGGRLGGISGSEGKMEMKQRYVGSSARGDVIVYGKRLA